DLADRGEILEGVVGQFWIEELVQRMAAGDQDQRVAVRRRLRERLRRDRAAGARTIFDDRLLSPGLRQRLPERARQYVDGAAGGVGHQDPYGLGRERLRINVGA